MACEKYGFRAPDLDDLVAWSIVIDGAQYPDAKTAVELGAPAMKLTLVIEAAKGSDIVQKIIGWMQRRPLAEIIAEPEIQELYRAAIPAPPGKQRIIKSRAHQDDGVIFFDLAGLRRRGLQQVHPVLPLPRAPPIRCR